jgi:hypothetical protein
LGENGFGGCTDICNLDMLDFAILTFEELAFVKSAGTF